MLNHERDCHVSACLRWFHADLDPAFKLQVPLRLRPVKKTSLERKKRNLGIEYALQFREREAADVISNELDWADNLRFGELSFSAQRLALFLRAIVKKPDIVILDEAFSGMDAALRDKCMLFLAYGETRVWRPTALNETNAAKAKKISSSKASGKDSVRMTGLTKEQALIAVSHVKEEVPGVVREWLCLPEPNGGMRARMGRLKVSLESDWDQWSEIWDQGNTGDSEL